MLGPFRTAAVLASLFLVQACATITGVPVPDHGKYVDAAAGRAPAPAAPAPEYVALRPVLKGRGVLEDNALTTYARTVLDRLLASWPGQRPAVTLYVTPDEGFTAEAARDGVILLSVGTFRYLVNTETVRSEDALAFILAHEAAHIILGHASQRQGTADAVHRAGGVVNVAGRLVAGTKFVQAADVAKKVVGGMELFLEASDETVFPSWSRGQEYQADALAVDLMARAGYSPQVVPDIMQVLDAVEKQSQRNVPPPPQLFQTRQNGFTVQPGAPLLQLMQALKRGHPAVDDRDKDVRAYIEREWGDQLVARDTGRLRRAAAAPEMRRLLTETDLVNQAELDLQNRNPRAALARLRSLQPGSPVDRSMVAGMVRLRAGLELGDRSALQQLDPASRHPRATAMIYRIRAAVAEQAGGKQEAAAIWAADWDRLEDPVALPQQIRLAKATGRSVDLLMLKARCISLGEAEMQQRCAQAAGS